MKSLIAVLMFTFAISLSAKNLTPNLQNPDKKGTVTTTDTKTTVSKDGKTTKKITKKISKTTTKKECATSGGCCSDDSQKDCSDTHTKNSK